MNKLRLDATFSAEIAQQINSKATTSFKNAYKAAALIEDAFYVQGFLTFPGEPYLPVEHSWIELDERIIDPTLPHLNLNAQELYYFPAHRLSVTQMTSAVEEAIEDYPKDDPLPVYGATPYEYYGDRMLGGADYTAAYKAAEAKCIELNSQNTLGTGATVE